MRGNSLIGSLALGAVAALGSIPWTLVVAPAFGRSWAVASYCLAAAVVYVVAIAPSWSRGVEIGALAGLLAAAAGVLAPWSMEAILGAVVILAVARSGLLYRSRPARALLIEGLLGAGGMLFAYALAEPTLLGTALGIWGFFLVQSLFFLAGGVQARREEAAGVDPFERARKRALALMEEG